MGLNEASWINFWYSAWTKSFPQIDGKNIPPNFV